MTTLDKGLRNKLENTIIRAREVAEEAAKSAIEQLGVEQSSPYTYLTEEQRELRRRLRAHARQLGDLRDPRNETQEIVRLTEEVAYEHWHRMLFARFLAENQLLMFFEGDDIENAVAVSLEECREMASEIGYANGWELATKLAAKMLPQIFRPESPVFELRFSPEKQKSLEVLLSELGSEVFTASDSLGWVYQFWQSKKKKEVNESGDKIGARELPAVTQLFTEPYMVSFLLDNSLGAWWVKKVLSEEDLMSATTEEELRAKASIPGVPLNYLRFVKQEEGLWSPAGGTLEGWPDSLSKLKVLDPCCGSGHFLVASFQMLVSMRMELEGLLPEEACNAVLTENIHGLEIDQRCVELAAFAVALTAWKYPRAGGFRRLPDLQIAWCGQSVNVKREEWLALAEEETGLMHLEWLYKLFQDAPVLGSLLNPRRLFEDGSFFQKHGDWDRVSKVLQGKLEKKKNYNDGLGVVAQGIEKAYQMLGDKYHLVISNPPYLGERKQNSNTRAYIQKYYKVGKADIATAFIFRGEEYTLNLTQCLVLPQNWLYQKSYQAVREKLLRGKRISMICQLGSQAFNSPVGADVILIILHPQSHKFSGLDASKKESVENKSDFLMSENLSEYCLDDVLMNSESRIALQKIDTSLPILGNFAEAYAGILNGDTERFILKFWEVTDFNGKWEFIQGSVKQSVAFGGRDSVILWENENGELRKLAIELKERLHNADRRGNQAWGKNGVVISQMGELPCTLYTGNKFDQCCAVILPTHEKYLPAIWTFCSSNEYNNEVRKIDKKKNITNGTLVKVPFDIDYWQKVANEKYPNGLPKPCSDGPTQWVFHGHSAQSEAPLQVAVAKLLGYRWPAELDNNMELSDESREFTKKCNILLPYADDDGIVCIPPVRGEASASERLLNLLAIAFKGQDITTILSSLLASSDHAGKSLDSWLRDKFFTQHCKLFAHRPFIWHIWDGLSDGFAALVNYHKLDRKNLESLTYTYLGDWINKQRTEIVTRVDGAEERLAAAESLKKSLELILEGEDPYDIFVRWKPIHSQPIGWNPDINDGVRMNIRPFMTVPDVGKRGAGILRDKPNIKWGKDRGKDTVASPWYAQFKGDRINDYHLKLDEKIMAQEKR